jgi:UDP-galactopyranose mutase
MNIVGGGLAGCVLASLIPNSIIYEKGKIGGLCRDNKNYQDFVHVLHTDNKMVWDFVNTFTTVKPHSTLLKSYVNGELKAWPAKEMTDEVYSTQVVGYSQKMWRQPIPDEARARITTNDDGKIFHNTYEGVPDFTRLFNNLTKFTHMVNKDVRDGDLDGRVILTGAIDEYFNYCYGKLPYRGMGSVHYPSEVRLDADFVTFSDEKIPYQRLVDYDRLGYEGGYIGLEYACDAKHYPIRNKESIKLYNKYKKLANKKGIKLVGRLATFHYQDMDQVIADVFKLVRKLHEDSNRSK